MVGLKTEDLTVATTPISQNIQGSNDYDSTPLDFDTFVPSYNPSFGPPSHSHPSPAPGPDHVSHLRPPGPPVDEDEAFTRALDAMYWGGYWTAVYHCRKSIAHNGPKDEKIAGQDSGREHEASEQASDEDLGFVSTQR